MHLWWEGIAKHMLQWLCAKIDADYKAKNVTGGLALLDDCIMAFNTRHNDHRYVTNMPILILT